MEEGSETGVHYMDQSKGINEMKNVLQGLTLSASH